MKGVRRLARKTVLGVLSLCLLLVSCGRQNNNPGDGQASGVPVEVVRLKGENAVVEIERVGVLRGSAEVEVVPKVAGRIQQVLAVRGQRVRRADVLAVIEEADYVDGLEQARAGLAMAEANLAQAEFNIRRQRALFDEGIASDAVLEAAESAFQIASAGRQQARAALEMTERQLADTRIVSPMDGFIASRMVEVGTFASPPAVAFNVVALDPMEVQVVLSDHEIVRVELGARAVVTVGALSGKGFVGEVTEVSVAADRMSGGFPVTVRVPNPTGELRDGMTASIAIEVGVRSNAIVVSPDVLIERGGRWFAYVVRDTVAESRSVILGEWVGGGVIVEDGLREGEDLVIKGQAYLDDGTRVRVGEVGS